MSSFFLGVFRRLSNLLTAAGFVLGFFTSPLWANDKLHTLNERPLTVFTLGDVEGMISRWDSFVERSGIFYRGPGGSLNLRDGVIFVFQGDASDRGPHSLQILQSLVDLKERYPDRVVLIAGNREIRRLELLTMFSKESLTAQKEKAMKKALDAGEAPPDVNPLSVMKKFVGWDFRREELNLKEVMDLVSDKITFDSFLTELQANSPLEKYLRLSQLMFLDVSTRTIFVHGAVNTENFGRVPGQTYIPQIRHWAEALNTWYHQQVDAGLTKSHGSFNGAQGLLDYVKLNNPNVVTNRFDDSVGFPEPPEKDFLAELMRQGFFRISVGHTPSGEAAVISRSGPFQILLTDGSFNKSGVSPIVKMSGPRISSSSPSGLFIGGPDAPIEFEMTYDDVSEIGRSTRAGLVIGKLKNEFLTYRIGPQFSRIYTRFKAGELPPLLTRWSCRELF